MDKKEENKEYMIFYRREDECYKLRILQEFANGLGGETPMIFYGEGKAKEKVNNLVIHARDIGIKLTAKYVETPRF